MFEVITTGENRWYGEEGEKRLICDNRVITALRSRWITEKIKYVGSGKTSNAKPIAIREELMPIKRIDAVRTLKAQEANLDKINGKIDSLVKVNKQLLKMMEVGKGG